MPVHLLSNTDVFFFYRYVANVTMEAVSESQGEGVAGALALFCLTYNHLLIVLDDSELYDEQTPLPRKSVVRLIENIKILTFRLHWELNENQHTSTTTTTTNNNNNNNR